MAKSDGLFARIDVDIWFSEKVSKIRPAGALCFYFLVWTLAVRERNSNLNRTFVSHWSKVGLNLSVKTTLKYEKICVDAGVISITEDNMIIVHKVKECHAKLQWKPERKRGIRGLSEGGYGGSGGGDTGNPAGGIRDDTGANEKRREEKIRNVRSHIKDSGNNSRTGIGEIATGFISEAEGVDENALDGYVDELMIGLKLRPAERGSLKRLSRKYPKAILNDVFLTVKDSMNKGRESGLNGVDNPIALFQYLLKAQAKG